MKTFDEYQQETMKTAVYDKDVAVTYLALGLASEAGEVAGKVKKWVRGDTSYVDTDEIAKELGDVLWYVSQMAETLTYPLGISHRQMLTSCVLGWNVIRLKEMETIVEIHIEFGVDE